MESTDSCKERLVKKKKQAAYIVTTIRGISDNGKDMQANKDKKGVDLWKSRPLNTAGQKELYIQENCCSRRNM